jgi:pimeloyl-ACP methyl ester carboxylesterase
MEITIHYEVIGKGKPTIVFHHGNGNRIEDWRTLGYASALN